MTRKKPGSGLLGPNQILTDFNVFDIYNEQEVTAKIQEVDATFHLVMILERFQESLILMRNILGWSFDDIKNLKLNARKETKVVITNGPGGVCAKYSTFNRYSILYLGQKGKLDEKINVILNF